MAIIHIIPYFSSFRHVLILSIAIRVVLIIYSEWHDARSLVKYTDIDYRIFSDAASFLLHPGDRNIAQGPLKSWIRLGEYVVICCRVTDDAERVIVARIPGRHTGTPHCLPFYWHRTNGSIHPLGNISSLRVISSMGC